MYICEVMQIRNEQTVSSCTNSQCTLVSTHYLMYIHWRR